mmetsp:Transcript_31445/g.48096  ORF Transcript_31445/g.48096 Transcript_31445/m.48096 type:complete len:100 (-) Transcript_31445:40-339(-)
MNSLAGPGSSPYQNQVFLNSFYSSKTVKRPSRNDTSPKEKVKQINKDIERQFSKSTFEKQLDKQDLREPLRQQQLEQAQHVHATNPDQPLANSILSKIS